MRSSWQGVAACWLALSVPALGQATDPPRSESPEAEEQRPKRRKGVTLSSGERPRNRQGVTLASGERPERVTRQPWMVMFSVRDADLATEVLPLFERQVGIRIEYDGPARKVTLPLVRPLDWELALELVCQFTDTHLVEDFKGRLVIEEGWVGRLEVPRLTGRYDPALRHALPPRRIPMIRIVRGRPLNWNHARPARVGPRRVGPRRPWPGVEERANPRVGPLRTGPRERGGPSKVGVEKDRPDRPWPSSYGKIPRKREGPRRVGPRETRTGNMRPKRPWPGN